MAKGRGFAYGLGMAGPNNSSKAVFPCQRRMESAFSTQRWASLEYLRENRREIRPGIRKNGWGTIFRWALAACCQFQTESTIWVFRHREERGPFATSITECAGQTTLCLRRLSWNTD